MTGLDILFLVIAAATLFAALRVVTAGNIIHAALWLVATLFGIAVLFVLLNAAFLAVVQVVVYIGAIAILMIFAIMLTRKTMLDSGAQANANWFLAVVIAMLLFAGLAIIITQSGAADVGLPNYTTDGSVLIEDLGQALVSPQAYILPFELASVLLLAALIGAIVVAWKK